MLSNALNSYEAIINSNPHCIEIIEKRCIHLYREAKRRSLKSISLLLNGRRRDTIAYTQDIDAKISRVYTGSNPVSRLLSYDPSDDMSDDIQKARVIAKYMGISTFRPEQETIICASLAGKPVLVNFPTGYGKSICFTLPAILQDSITVVIVPFVSIIESQLHVFASLHKKISDLSTVLGCQSPTSIYDLVGCFVGKDNRSRYMKKDLRNFSMDYRTILGLCDDNEHSMPGEDTRITSILSKRLIYTTPESFLLIHNIVWQPLAQSGRLNRIVVDECHILISWALVFKKDYITVCRKIAWFRTIFQTNISLFSGSLTELKRDLLLSWTWNGDDIYYFTTHNIVPSNVKFMITKCADQDEVLRKSLSQAEHFFLKYNTTTTKRAEKLGCKGIIFCLTKTECVSICDMLKSKKIHALPFHSTTTTTLSTIEKADIVVSTSCLSHGVNLQDVDFVIVCGCCLSVNELIQYGGRCGRRGQCADYNFIYSSTDLLRSLHLKIVTQPKRLKMITMNNPNGLFISSEIINYVSFFSVDEFLQLCRFLKAADPLREQEDIKNLLLQHMKQNIIHTEDDIPSRQRQIFVIVVLLIYYLTISFNICNDRPSLQSTVDPLREPPLFYQPSVPEYTHQDRRLIHLTRLDFIIAILTGDYRHVKSIIMQCFSDSYLSGRKFSLSVLANALVDQLGIFKHSLAHNEHSMEHRACRRPSKLERILGSIAINNSYQIHQFTSQQDNRVDSINQGNDMDLLPQLKIDEAGFVVEILQDMIERMQEACNCTDITECKMTEKEIVDTVLYFLQLKALYIESSTESSRSVHATRVSSSTKNFCITLWTKTAELFTKCMDTLVQIPSE